MRWEDKDRSDNVEDRRGMPVSRGVLGGGIGTVILVVVALYFGIDPSVILQSVPQSGPPPVTQQQQKAGSDSMSQFISVVLADTEKTWHDVFRRYGRTYEEPKVVLFTGAVQSACGFAQAAMGPFYCPQDHKVYLDLSFYEDLKNRFQAPGDFAQAYVIAHEVGHHVQNLLGITGKVQGAMQRVSKADANRLSVKMELQADCLAGVWGYHADKLRNLLEAGDLEEALRAASAIGDDRIMRKTRGTIVPDAFTHGTSEQRVRWFKRGFETGDLNRCDTFNAQYL
ncbi:MAG TPA: flagellar biosynthesis protein FlgM [Syntrophaceae bacterium]|nr:flagellar biosynthesis protein FlgM [Syntrophaceae bacterium]